MKLFIALVGWDCLYVDKRACKEVQ